MRISQTFKKLAIVKMLLRQNFSFYSTIIRLSHEHLDSDISFSLISHIEQN